MKSYSFFFDMDGTLVDSEPIHYAAYKALLAESGFSFPEEVFAQFVGKSTLENIRWLMQHYPLPAGEGILAAKKKSYFVSFLDHITLFPGVSALLNIISKEHPLALVTSTKRNLTNKILERTQIQHCFQWIITGDDGLPKPDPSLYRIALVRSNFSPEQVIAFEDSLSGYSAATAAGISCLCIPNKYTQHQFSQSHKTFLTLQEAVGGFL